MIGFIERLPVGNALRVLLTPPAGAVKWRLLRKLADDFAGHDDPDAALIYEGDDLRNILDTESLVNGTPYYYREYALVVAAWAASPTVSSTPIARGALGGPDPLTLVRERLELALREAVAAGRLTHELGYIPCLTAPPQFEDARWPLVTVHLDSDRPQVRGIGEIVAPDFLDGEEWQSSEGWLADTRLQIVGWSLNPDQRIALRLAIKAGILGNLSVFDEAGLTQIDTAQSDIEDFERYGAPVYQTVCSLSCLAPSVFVGPDGTPVDIEVVGEALQ